MLVRLPELRRKEAGRIRFDVRVVHAKAGDKHQFLGVRPLDQMGQIIDALPVQTVHHVPVVAPPGEI